MRTDSSTARQVVGDSSGSKVGSQERLRGGGSCYVVLGLDVCSRLSVCIPDFRMFTVSPGTFSILPLAFE